jgi:hypothetical protein
MYSVMFLWPDNDAEEDSFRKFGCLQDAIDYGTTKMDNMPGCVMCLVVRPNQQSIRMWWEGSRLVSNLPDLERTEPSLAQKVDWRKFGF